MIFRPELAAKVIAGEKTATRRRMNDNPRSPWWSKGTSYTRGQEFAVQPGRGKASVGKARITRVDREPLRSLTPLDARREGFPTRAAFVEAWKAINGSWDPDELVHVLEFEVL
jgi:hypothetical protein